MMRAKVLVLQEIENNLNCVTSALNTDEYEIRAAREYKDAMHEIKKNPFDLIVSAVHLKSGNVFELLQYSKQSATNKSAAFVFFCAEPSEFARYVSAAIRTAGKVLGADEYITMDPFDPAKFRKSIDKLLSERGKLPCECSEVESLQPAVD